MESQHLDAMIECEICHNFDVCKPMALRRPDAFRHVPEASIPVWRDDPVCDACEASMRRVCEIEGKVVRVWANVILRALAEPASPDSPASVAQRTLCDEAGEAGVTSEAGIINAVRGDQHPDFMAGLERALEVRRYDPNRPVGFILSERGPMSEADLLKALEETK